MLPGNSQHSDCRELGCEPWSKLLIHSLVALQYGSSYSLVSSPYTSTPQLPFKAPQIPSNRDIFSFCRDSDQPGVLKGRRGGGCVLRTYRHPGPSNYPLLDSKYHQIRTIRFQLRVVGRSRMMGMVVNGSQWYLCSNA